MSTTYLTNTEAVTIELATAAGRVQRTITIEDLLKAVKTAEATLTKFGVAKKNWTAVTIAVNPVRNRQPSTKAYSYHADAVNVVLSRNSVGWYLETVKVRGALYDTVANRLDSFVSIPNALLSFSQMKTALGIVTPDAN